jgi:membrane-associated phospholipid phosphatase
VIAGSRSSRRWASTAPAGSRSGATAHPGRAYLVNTTLKLIVRRPRPQLPGLPALATTPTGLGFPSAHATTSFAAARRYARLVDGRPLYALAATLAASRLYLGVHHPSDVAAGAALGTAIAGRGGRRWR